RVTDDLLADLIRGVKVRVQPEVERSDEPTFAEYRTSLQSLPGVCGVNYLPGRGAETPDQIVVYAQPGECAFLDELLADRVDGRTLAILEGDCAAPMLA
ncbi:MAG: hypothetical protein AB1758_27055, partial [Candidatus Eremiobacterota bacterium]